MIASKKRVTFDDLYPWRYIGRPLLVASKWFGFLLLVHCVVSSPPEDNFLDPKLPASRSRLAVQHPLGNSVQLRPTDKDYRFPLWAAGSHVLPSFDKKVERNVTTQLGQTGYLHCVVNNLGDKTISWIRRKDFHVLTVGLDTYTSEDRFEAVHVSSTNDWALKIKYADIHDSGTYECQVSSDPKISFFVNLNVVVAVARILGAPDLFVRKGSAINLTCIISQSPDPPRFVFWYHDDRMINYDATKAEINVQKDGEDTAISRLYIRSADIEDSGNYTCCPSNAEATSISVVVLLGEKPAAMQHDSVQINSSPMRNNALRSFLCVFIWILVSLRRYPREWFCYVTLDEYRDRTTLILQA